MLKLVDTDTGKEYEVGPQEATHKGGGLYLTDGGCYAFSGDVIIKNLMRHTLTEIRKRHTFGGIVFEEAGEKRIVQDRDFYVDLNGRLAIGVGEGCIDHVILRPVEVVTEEG